VFGAGSVAIAIAPAAWVFLAGRAAQGAGAALIVPGTLALVLPEYPDDRRMWVAGTLTSLNALGQAFSPTAAALLVQAGGWRLVFLPAIVASAVTVVLGRVVFRESVPVGTDGRVDSLGVPMGSAAVALLVFAVMEGPRWGWTAPGVLVPLAGSLVLLPVFIVRSARHPRPLIDLDLVRRRSVWSATLGFFLVAGTGTTMWFVLPLYFHETRGYSLLLVGMAITPMAIGSSAGAALGTRAVRRAGLRSVAVSGAALMAAGAATMVGFAGSDVAFAYSFLPALAVCGLGIGLSQGPLAGLSVADVGPAEFGQANGFFHTMRFVSAGLGTAVVVAVLGNADPIPASAFQRTFLVQTGAGVACVLLELVLLPRRGRGR
jgi:MFS family permease